MHFTVVLSGPDDDQDHSYGLVFIPCPVWVQGRREVVNPHPDYPHYRTGDFGRLLKAEKLSDRTAERAQCVIVIHADGHGTYEDLAELVRDVRTAGFAVSLAGTLPAG